MNRDWKNIPYPDEETISKEVRTIVADGLDPKASFWSYLVTMYRHVGFRHVFHDLTEILFTLFVLVAVLLTFGLSISDWVELENINLYTAIFIWSPITYAVMAYLFIFNQKQKPSYEVEMTCKYNLHQLAAFRMLAFSVISMIMNGVLIYFLMIQQELNYFYAILLSSTSLFVFAVVFLLVQLHAKSPQPKLMIASGWVIGNLVVSYYSTEFYLNFLTHIPFYVYGVIAVSSIVLYYKKLNELLFATRMKGLI
ncbi:hypothetical protein [Alkalihalobacillus sp. AL-G]|uniref:hypothetical protein n=1 Tax=Alkalihalobacillus sp. AL-G TaxID=2926399 RepID=UPI00272B9B40|nr:hypothetical protein [Alkalihalobacillus sp. AL-G]WLD94671.1 hypothetical protein MOJ78_07250 [Alkalihalobacillus sp. AL-G]